MRRIYSAMKKSARTYSRFQIVIFCQLEVNKKLTAIQPILNLGRDLVGSFTAVGYRWCLTGSSKPKAFTSRSEKRRAYEIHTSND
jgi:hypothetical protein